MATENENPEKQESENRIREKLNKISPFMPLYAGVYFILFLFGVEALWVLDFDKSKMAHMTGLIDQDMIIFSSVISGLLKVGFALSVIFIVLCFNYNHNRGVGSAIFICIMGGVLFFRSF